MENTVSSQSINLCPTYILEWATREGTLGPNLIVDLLLVLTASTNNPLSYCFISNTKNSKVYPKFFMPTDMSIWREYQHELHEGFGLLSNSMQRSNSHTESFFLSLFICFILFFIFNYWAYFENESFPPKLIHHSQFLLSNLLNLSQETIQLRSKILKALLE